VTVIAVGGIGPSAMAEWQGAGASGFGLGSELYRPGLSAAEVSAKTAACVGALGR
jgi:2-dehydro-3-deoxyphosphogalactonate aldolase